MKQFVALLLCATLAGLCYVYEEVEAVKIGYEIRKKDEKKTLLLDRARALKYNIAHLQAPHNLEKKLSAQRIELQAPKSWQTLVFADDRAKGSGIAGNTLNRPFISRFFVGTAQAEAKESRTR